MSNPSLSGFLTLLSLPIFRNGAKKYYNSFLVSCVNSWNPQAKKTVESWILLWMSMQKMLRSNRMWNLCLGLNVWGMWKWVSFTYHHFKYFKVLNSTILLDSIRFLLMEHPLNFYSTWKCNECDFILSVEDVERKVCKIIVKYPRKLTFSTWFWSLIIFKIWMLKI